MWTGLVSAIETRFEDGLPPAGKIANQDYQNLLHLVKPWDMHWRRADARIVASMHFGGDTPTLPGLRASAERLLARPERRRVLMLITDGEPNEGMQERTAVAALARAVRRSGIEIAPIGLVDVHPFSMGHMFGDGAWVHADTASLGRTMLGELEKRLTAGQRRAA